MSKFAGDRAVWIFPLCVVALFVGLIALDLNGSSVALFGSTEEERAASVVAGQPRAIRSDEWVIATPLAVQAALTGFPQKPWVGLTATDVAASVNVGPSSNWSEIARPQDWGYFTLGASRGLAWHWWFSFVICLLGTYSLAYLWSRRVAVSVAASFVATFSPYTAWWSAPSTALLIGFGACAVASLSLAVRARRTRPTLLWSALGGYSLVALVFVLYPPWVISIGWIAAGAALGVVLDNWRSWKKTAATLVPAGALSILAVGAWALQNREAIVASANTVYPGERISTAGGATVQWLSSAPSTFWLALTKKPNPVPQPSNLSEIAVSWLPLPLVFFAMIVALYFAWDSRRGRLHSRREDLRRDDGKSVVPEVRVGQTPSLIIGFWTALGTSIGFSLILAWAVLPLPQIVGQLTLLQRVSPQRTPAALGLGAVLIVVVAVVVVRRPVPRWVLALGSFAVLLGAAMAVQSKAALPVRDLHINSGLLALSALLLMAPMCWLILARRQWPAALILSAYCFAAWAIVNPLMHGLGPLATDPLVLATKEYQKDHPNAIYATIGDDSIQLDALVRAGGGTSISGATYYPDVPLMETLAPGRSDVWNNYVNYVWQQGGTSAPITFEKIFNAVWRLKPNLCANEFKKIGLNVVISSRRIENVSCLKLDREINRGESWLFDPGETTLYRYEIR